MKVPKSSITTKPPAVTVRIVPGKATERERRLWQAFWRQLAEKARGEGQGAVK